MVRESPAKSAEATTPGSAQAWRVDNGRGDYAAGPTGLGPPRPSDGLLVLSSLAPEEPRVLVTHCEVTLSYTGHDWCLGERGLQDDRMGRTRALPLPRFETRCANPQWTWELDDLVVRMRIWMARGEPTTYLRLEVIRADANVMVTLSPWIASAAYAMQACRPVQGGFSLGRPGDGDCRVVVDAAVFRCNPTLADATTAPHSRTGDAPAVRAWLPGSFDAELADGEAVALVCSMRKAIAPAAQAWARACAEHARDVQSTIAE